MEGLNNAWYATTEWNRHDLRRLMNVATTYGNDNKEVTELSYHHHNMKQSTGMQNGRIKMKCPNKNVLQSHYAHCKFNKVRPGIDPGPLK